MPSYWYSARDNIIENDDLEEEKAKKEFNSRIVASNKPYFMIYVYPHLKRKYNNYVKNSLQSAVRRFRQYKIKNVSDLYKFKLTNQDIADFLKYYEGKMPVGSNQCVVNKVCWFAEKAFKDVKEKRVKSKDFDYSILKSGVQYSKNDFKQIEKIYKDYVMRVDSFLRSTEIKRMDKETIWFERQRFVEVFKADCQMVCPNEDELCDIVLDLCYRSERTKQFAWDVCGNIITRNLLSKSGNVIRYPKRVETDGEFVYCGEQFIMREKVIDQERNDIVE